MRILVVDDNKFNLKVANGYLRNLFPEYEILSCQNPYDVNDVENAPRGGTIFNISIPINADYEDEENN